MEKDPPKTGCLPLLALVFLIFFALAGAAFTSVFILDPGPYTMSQRKERYKVAGQFIWYDFKNWVSRRFSDEPPPGTEKDDPFF